MIDLGIKFPDHLADIRNDALRFRQLTPAEQVTELCEAVGLYYYLREMGGNAETIDRFADLEEAKGRQAILDMVRRYG